MAKILYVDADHQRSEVVCALFVENGHSVTLTNSAERAMIQVAAQSDFDAIVLHLILPGIDGAELCRWLQRRSSLPSVPRVVFTSPEVRLKLELQERLPRWLPADLYIHGLEELGKLIDGVEQILCGR